MTVMQLIEQLIRTSRSLDDEVVMSDGQAVTSVSRADRTAACGIIYLGDAPEDETDNG